MSTTEYHQEEIKKIREEGWHEVQKRLSKAKDADEYTKLVSELVPQVIEEAYCLGYCDATIKSGGIATDILEKSTNALKILTTLIVGK